MVHARAESQHTAVSNSDDDFAVFEVSLLGKVSKYQPDCIKADSGKAELPHSGSVRTFLFPDHGVRCPLLMLTVLAFMFAVERLAILIAGMHYFKQVPAGDIIKAFLVGLRFDVSIACLLIIPLLPLILITGKTPSVSWQQKLMVRYCSLVLGCVFFVCAADFFFYLEFSERLNYQVIEYFRYDYIYAVIWDQYPVLTVTVIMLGIIIFSGSILQRLIFSESGWNIPLNNIKGKALAFFSRSGWFALLVVSVAAGFRGSWGPKPLNAGPAYFTESCNVAQLALNGLFTLREAIVDTAVRSGSLDEYFHAPDTEEALAAALDVYVRPEDKVLKNTGIPLNRITVTGRPRQDYNVVLVMMESLSWHYIGAMGGRENLTPNLDSLIADGLLFDNCYAVGSRTTRGLSGIVCGFPDLPGKSVTTRSKCQGNFPTLVSVLARRGYETVFIYGGQAMYDHRQSFLASNGCSRFVFPDSFEKRTFRTHLGYCDGDLFDQADLEFSRMAGEPFFGLLLTLSFHRDYSCPTENLPPSDRLESNHKAKQCVRYMDWAIGRFIRKARKQPYFDRTVFVFTADHPGGYRKDQSSPCNFRIPFLVYAPAIVKPGRCTKVASQTDIAPTIMSLLGGSYENSFFGSSIPDRPAEDGMAIMYYSDQFVMINGDREGIIIRPGRQSSVFTLTGNDQYEIISDTCERAVNQREKLTGQAASIMHAAQTFIDEL